MGGRQTPPLPDKRYSIIYADPPWKVSASYITGASGIKSHVSDHYDLMPLSEICALPIADIAAENCLLFLWITSPELFDAEKVGKAWGFKYITIAFVWDKQRPLKGHYTMSQCELCLLFKKGKIPKPRGATNIRQFLSVNKGRHSVKPYQVRDRITKMFPHHKRIELFARPLPLFATLNDGWDYWGNEA